MRELRVRELELELDLLEYGGWLCTITGSGLRVRARKTGLRDLERDLDLLEHNGCVYTTTGAGWGLQDRDLRTRDGDLRIGDGGLSTIGGSSGFVFERGSLKSFGLNHDLRLDLDRDFWRGGIVVIGEPGGEMTTC